MAKQPHYKKKRINKDKVKAYLREYTTNGFNKTKALNTINPTAKYSTNHTNSEHFHKRAMTNSDVIKTYDISHITPEYIISSVEGIFKDHKASHVAKLKAMEMIGDFKRIWADKGVNISTNIVNKADLEAIKGTFNRMLTSKQKLVINPNT